MDICQYFYPSHLFILKSQYKGKTMFKSPRAFEKQKYMCLLVYVHIHGSVCLSIHLYIYHLYICLSSYLSVALK